MKRDLNRLSRESFDIAVVGGGILGSCVAWDAACRGMSTALIEKGDFCSATSANSLKIIHGGLRYLQHADIGRMRESIRERSILMRIAPHLVRPLPCLVPTWGAGKRSRMAMTLALAASDLVGLDRNRMAGGGGRLPPGRTVSRGELGRLAPGLDTRPFSGGALWHDCQVLNSERLVLSFLHSADRAGAALANHAEATGFLGGPGKVEGLKVRDALTGEEFDLRARLVINAAGPWTRALLARHEAFRHAPIPPFCKAWNVITRPLGPDLGLGIPVRTQCAADMSVTGNRVLRFLFIAPWRGVSTIGTAYARHDGPPGEARISEAEIGELLSGVNSLLPGSALRLEDVRFVHAGLLPAEAGPESGGGAGVSLTRKPAVLDHARSHGIQGLISAIGVKYTTARGLAERTVDLAILKAGRRPIPCRTASLLIHGADVGDPEAFPRRVERENAGKAPAAALRRLSETYGSACGEVLPLLAGRPDLVAPLCPDSPAIMAEVVHAVREEMALKLSDVLLRRSDVGSAGNPGEAAMKAAAAIMAAELAWTESRVRSEVEEAGEAYRFLPRHQNLNLKPTESESPERSNSSNPL